MLLDSGILTLYKLINTAESGRMPDMKLQKYENAYFGERTVGYNRLYAAKGVNQQVDKLVRMSKPEIMQFWIIRSLMVRSNTESMQCSIFTTTMGLKSQI